MTESPCKPTSVSDSAPVLLVVAILGLVGLFAGAVHHDIFANSSPGLLHGEGWNVLKGFQLLLELCQIPGD